MKKRYGIFWLLCCSVMPGAEAQLRDPTEPPDNLNVKTFETKESLRVSAIIISGTRRHAVINDQMVSEGDKVAGRSVVSIHLNSVTLIENGRKTVLHLGTEKPIKERIK